MEDSIPPPAAAEVEAALQRLETLGYRCRSSRIGPPEKAGVLLFIHVPGMRGLKGFSEVWACVGEPGEVLALDASTLTHAHIEPLLKRLRIHFAHKLIIQWMRSALPEVEPRGD
jgi:hypothetical protein